MHQSHSPNPITTDSCDSAINSSPTDRLICYVWQPFVKWLIFPVGTMDFDNDVLGKICSFFEQVPPLVFVSVKITCHADQQTTINDRDR